MAMPGTLRSSLREAWKDLRQSRPGHRFQDRYQRAKQAESRAGMLGRIALFAVAIAALAIGAVLSVIPGPAFPFFIIAGALLATESRAIARFMDWAEVRVRNVLAWGKRRWRQRRAR